MKDHDHAVDPCDLSKRLNRIQKLHSVPNDGDRKPFSLPHHTHIHSPSPQTSPDAPDAPSQKEPPPLPPPRRSPASPPSAKPQLCPRPLPLRHSSRASRSWVCAGDRYRSQGLAQRAGGRAARVRRVRLISSTMAGTRIRGCLMIGVLARVLGRAWRKCSRGKGSDMGECKGIEGKRTAMGIGASLALESPCAFTPSRGVRSCCSERATFAQAWVEGLIAQYHQHFELCHCFRMSMGLLLCIAIGATHDAFNSYT
jgi:hypothetical protein